MFFNFLEFVEIAKVWGVNPLQNKTWLNKSEDVMTTGFGLVFGAIFGFRAVHDSRRYSQYGQIKVVI